MNPKNLSNSILKNSGRHIQMLVAEHKLATLIFVEEHLKSGINNFDVFITVEDPFCT